MATPRHGRNARLMLAIGTDASPGSAVAISSKNKWSVDNSIDTVEVTSFGDTTKAFVAGLPNNSGDLSGFWDSDDTSIMSNLIGSSVARKFYLYPDYSNSPGTYFYTTAFVGMKIEGGTAEAVAFTGTWTGATAGHWVAA